MPKVSIIIPIYNTEEFLSVCLNSVCKQSLSDIEIICINDCSSDKSLEILKKYSNNDERLKIIDLYQNCGVSTARNIGIEIAKSEYIGFVDSDDFIALDFYEKLYAKAISTKADAVKGTIFEFNQQTGKNFLTNFYDKNSEITKNWCNFYYGFSSAIYDRKFIIDNQIKFPRDINYFEDPYFSIQACLKYKNLQIVNDAKYYYRNRQNSLSKKENGVDVAKVAPKILEIIEKENEENYKILFDFIFPVLRNSIESKFDDWELICQILTDFLITTSKPKLVQKYISLSKSFLPKKNITKFLRAGIKNEARKIITKKV